MPGEWEWEQLPADYLSADVRLVLSADAQIYYRCDACGAECRVNRTLQVDDPRRMEGIDCPMCGAGALAIIVHSRMQELPRRFCNLQDALDEIEVHVWGADADSDVDRLISEVGATTITLISTIGSSNYLIPAIMFGQRLSEVSDYPPADSWRLLNVAGVLLRDYYRDTGELAAGRKAFTVFQACADAIPDTPERGMVEHNVAMTAYSLMAKQQPEFLLTGEHEKVRETGIAAAKAALRRYGAALAACAAPGANPSPADQGIRVQIARVNQTLADLTWALRSGDRAALAEAIRLYDLAIAEPALPAQLRDYAENAKVSAIMSVAGPAAVVAAGLGDRLESYADAAGAPPAQRVSALLAIAKLRESRDGGPASAESPLRTAVSLAEEQIFATADEVSAAQVAETYHLAFDALARNQVAMGNRRRQWRPLNQSGHFRCASREKQRRSERPARTKQWA